VRGSNNVSELVCFLTGIQGLPSLSSALDNLIKALRARRCQNFQFDFGLQKQQGLEQVLPFPIAYFEQHNHLNFSRFSCVFPAGV